MPLYAGRFRVVRIPLHAGRLQLVRKLILELILLSTHGIPWQQRFHWADYSEGLSVEYARALTLIAKGRKSQKLIP
jgi:hypothetical protein